MDTLGSPNPETSHEYGAAAYKILAILQQQLVKAGVGAVLESNFLRGVSEKDLRPILPKSRSAAIYCETMVEESLRRFEDDATTRWTKPWPPSTPRPGSTTSTRFWQVRSRLGRIMSAASGPLPAKTTASTPRRAMR